MICLCVSPKKAISKRKNIRLKYYDYSQKGYYFVTICVHNKLALFGDVENQKIVLNDAGMMVEQWYRELENKFTNVRCDEFICMPNHVHFVIAMGIGLDGPAQQGGINISGAHAGISLPTS